MEKTLSRRDALKILAAATGGIALSTLPVWKRPFVGVGAMPAFAQTSRGIDDLEVTLTWNAGEQTCEESAAKDGPVDIDLLVFDPEDEFVDSNDNICGFGPEISHVAAGTAMSGTYEVWISFYDGQGPVTGTVTIRVFTGTSREVSRTFTKAWTANESGDGLEEDCWYFVATVDFPAGTITGKGNEPWCDSGEKRRKSGKK